MRTRTRDSNQDAAHLAQPGNLPHGPGDRTSTTPIRRNTTNLGHHQ
jgi:hypothetical protein